MKSLNEVIDDFEKACDLERRCENCSGCLGQEEGCPNDGAECVPDALYYLKEYQKIEDEYEELKDWWAEEHAENVPLTWDELKQMQGKPVWIEELHNGSRWYGFWDVISDAEDYGDEKTVYTKSEMRYEMAEYSTTWQAYRKKLK